MTASSAPAVSVLVTVYNREQYLATSLRGVLQSTFKDFEVIIVDDGSTDGSIEIAEDFAKRDERCRLFRNERNLGQFENRNEAARHARGTFIKYVDSDDFLYPHGLAVMYRAICTAPDAACAISSPIIDPPDPYPQELLPEEVYQREFLGRGCLSAGPSGSIIRTSAFREIGGFRSVGVISDIDLWYRLAARWNTVFMQPALVWWRQHENQAFTHQTADVDYLTGARRIASDALNADNCPLNEHDRQQALNRVVQHQSRRLLSMALRRRRPLEALRLAGQCGLSVRDLLRGLRRYQ